MLAAPVLIVMVTQTRYVIGDWQGNAASGTGPIPTVKRTVRKATKPKTGSQDDKN